MKTLSLLIPLLSLNSAAAKPLPDMLVTASRSAETADVALASVTVLDRKAIENSQALSLPDLLRAVPGVDIVNNGGLGQPASIFMRGTNSDHVLVLINGVKIGSPTLGNASLHLLPLDSIERIEIVRGPRSGLYGSEALGGVIHIFTRNSQSTPWQAHATYGANATTHFGLSHAGGSRQTRYYLSASRLDSDGFNACRGDASSGCFTVEPDDDGYDNTSFSARLTHQWSPALRLNAHSLRSEGHTEYDSSLQNQADYLQQVWGVDVDWQLGSSWLSHISYSQATDNADNFGNNTDHSVFDTQRTQWNWQNEWQLGQAHEVIVGYELTQDEVAGSTAYTLNARDNHGYYAQYRYLGRQWDMQAALRQEDNQQFGDHLTGNFALGFTFAQQLRAFLSYATAFAAPTFNDLYYPGFSNPSLQPEEADSLEIGLSQTQDNYQWRASLYQTQIDNLISTHFDPATGAFGVDNVDAATITGAELSASWRTAGGLDVRSQITWLDATDDANDKQLARRSPLSFNVELSETIRQSTMTIQVFAQQYRYDDRANQQRLGGYGVTHVRWEQQLDKHWSVQTRIDNVLDKEYSTVYQYNMPGRSYFIGLQYK